MDYFYTKMCLFDNKIISKKYLHFNNPSAVQLLPIYALCMVHLRFMSDLHNQKIVTIFESQPATGARCWVWTFQIYSSRHDGGAIHNNYGNSKRPLCN